MSFPDTAPKLNDSDNNLLFKICQILEAGSGPVPPPPVDTTHVLKAGDTMTGALVLPSLPAALQLGGTTSAFPALGRNDSTTTAQFRLADNSNYAPLEAGLITSQTGGMILNTVDSASIFAYNFSFKKRGTTGDVTGAVTTGSEVGPIVWQSWNGTAYGTNAAITVITDQNQSVGNAGAHLHFSTVAVGASSGTIKLQLGPTTSTFSVIPLNIATTSSLQLNGVAYFNPLSVFAAGTVYTLTATSAAVDFGTTDPAITITQAGTYVLRARVKVELNAATFGAVRVLTVKLRRTNNTAADVANASTTYNVPIMTGLTQTLAIFELNEVLYTTANTTDSIEMFADISVLPSAGTISINSASILALRIS